MNRIHFGIIVVTVLAAAFYALSLVVNKLSTTNLLASVFSSTQRQIHAECITSFSSDPISNFKLTQAFINSDSHVDVFVRYTDETSCGSAGCIHEICLTDATGTYFHLPFTLAARGIETRATISNGMKDLILNGDEKLTMSFNGSSYELNLNRQQ